MFLVGDFNFDLLKVNTHDETSVFFNKMMLNFLLPVISIPTKIYTVKDTLIDNIFKNEFSPYLISGNFTEDISDHLPSFLIIPKNILKKLPKNHTIYTRDLNKVDNENFFLELLAIDMVVISSNPNANDAFNNLFESTSKVIDDYFPLRKITNKEYKRRFKPWISKGILTSINRKSKLYKKYIKCKNNETKILLFNEYKTLRLGKKQYYTNFFTVNNNNLRKIWEGIKELVNIKPKNRDPINCIVFKGKNLTDPKEISNAFNKYFSTIADKLLSEKKYYGDKHYTDYLSNPLPNSFVFRSCDKIEIELLISELKINKSSGPNGIPIKILHLIKSIISEPLSIIFNNSILTGKYINKLKLSITIPIFKKGSRLLVSDYPPISLLSNLNKIMEKLIFKRIYEFFEIYNCLYDLQFGFRSKHSTVHALINITECVRSALDEGKYACGIFVDLQKAFGTVNHNILLDKLSHYGIRGNMNEWFKSYLQGRNQIVSINGVESELTELKHGVPQGSVLGPLLFRIYINYLNACISNSKVYYFADDTNLLHINSCFKKLQKNINYDLKSLTNWLDSIMILLNCTKTELVYFRKKRSANPNNNKIKLNGKKLIPTDHIKYLGVYLDETLSGFAHYDALSKKLHIANSMLVRTREYLSINELKSIYYSVFSSHLNYASQIWGLSDCKYTEKIFKIQKNAVRIISNSGFNAHTSPLFKTLEILKVRDKIILFNCLFVHDFLNGKLPKSFDSTFLKLSEARSNENMVNTINSDLGCLFLPNVCTSTYRLNSIYRKSIISWNTYVRLFNKEDIVSISKNALKNKIKKHMLSMY